MFYQEARYDIKTKNLKDIIFNKFKFILNKYGAPYSEFSIHKYFLVCYRWKMSTELMEEYTKKKNVYPTIN